MRELTERENLLLVLEGKEPEWVPVYTDACAHTMSPSIANKRDPVSGKIKDIFGVEFIQTIDGPMPDHRDGLCRLEDILDWRRVMPTIDLDAVDWEQEAHIIRNQIAKPGQAINLWAGGIWEKMHHLMGMENAMCALMEEPEESYKLLGAITDFYIDVLRREYRYLQPELVCFTDHMTTNKGLMLSASLYRELIKPHEKRFVDAVLDLGGVPEIHIDGYIEDLLPDFAEIGIKVIQPFQVFNDIVAAKETYGFVCVGGWDAFGRGNQADSTEEEARASVRLAMDTYAPGGKYIFWESGATPAFRDNAAIIRDEARKYGRSFYKKGV